MIVGKPYPPIVEAILDRAGFSPGEIVMVGDRLYTDIALGQSGLTTVLVLSGETDLEDVDGGLYRPDFIVPDLAGLFSKVLQLRSKGG